MDKVIWLIGGNKGGAGKSVVAKGVAEWLGEQGIPVTIVDGDKRAPDVASVFAGVLPTQQFDLHLDSGWPLFTDYLCQNDLTGHFVTNLPDGINDRAVLFFERFAKLVVGYGYTVKVLFVMNTLPDGLHMFARLVQSFPQVIPTKNLHFGRPVEFAHFDEAYGQEFADKVLFFPALQPKIMQVVRESNLSYQEFTAQTDDAVSNFSYAKVVVSGWRDDMLDALDDGLLGA